MQVALIAASDTPTVIVLVLIWLVVVAVACCCCIPLQLLLMLVLNFALCTGGVFLPSAGANTPLAHLVHGHHSCSYISKESVVRVRSNDNELGYIICKQSCDDSSFKFTLLSYMQSLRCTKCSYVCCQLPWTQKSDYSFDSNAVAVVVSACLAFGSFCLCQAAGII